MVVACGSDDEELPEVDCSSGVPTFAEVTAFQKCTGCHSTALQDAIARMGAPATINFNTYAAAEPHATTAVSEVKEGAMPPASANLTLTEDEKQALYKWALCGAQE